MTVPQTQYAVQLTGPDQLILNKCKEVFCPGAHQILCKVEAVGLCFSDLKLLKQFSSHVRKGELVRGIEPEVLGEIPSYVPGEAPTVPGHEAVVRIAQVGPGMENFELGRRYLVQTDYRWLRTATSNGAFGYNFEGALQEYVLMDERVITSPRGESMLLPASEELSASAVALVEPWACVEDAYASAERAQLKPGGRMLLVAQSEVDPAGLVGLFENYGRPGSLTWVSQNQPAPELGVEIERAGSIAELADRSFDDVLYYGSDPQTVEDLFGRVGTAGILNVVQCGGKFGRDIVAAVGRVHYGGMRIIGTTGSDPADSMATIPETGEIRPGDRINVVGAGGPMGVMHVIRNICQGVEGVSVFASDVDDDRLARLNRVAAGLARKNGVGFKTFNPTKDEVRERFGYTAIMVPIPALVAEAIEDSAERGLINIFAGIPATVDGRIDLDAYIQKRLYFIGTSGSTLEDMKRMLEKAESGRLDPNVSVAAVSGLDGAVEGIRAVENRQIAGKIVVYPACRGLGLVRLDELSEKEPQIAAELEDGLWTRAAEQALLAKYANQ